MKLKYLLNIMVLFLIIFAGISCKEKPTEPPVEEFPPGYQHDIPWPSLADSPWPINHADPQSTGRSKYRGPRKGIIKHIIDSLDIVRTVSMPDDTTFLVVSRGINKYYGISKFTIDGEFIWNYTNNRMVSDAPTPLPLRNGNIIYTNGLTRELYMLNKNGKVIWEKIFSNSIRCESIIVDKEGAIYFIETGNRKLYSINQNGETIWIIANENFYEWGGMSFSPDGKTLYLRGNTKSVIAIDVTTQQIKWTFGSDKITAPPLVDYEGNIYTLSTENDSVYIFSIKPDGTVRWKYVINIFPGNSDFWTALTIDRLGNIYVFPRNILYSFNYIGELRWTKDFNTYYNKTYLVSDIDGVVYTVISNIGQSSEKYVLIILNDVGNIINEIILENPGNISYSNVITKDGKLILPSTRSNKLYIIE